jgi:predicted DCC family thiol-disulfide oxidoreductase YuxK
MPEKPVEVFYNSACPVCDAGVRNQRVAMERRGSADLSWIDMTCAPEALNADGLTLDHVRRHIYARDASGKLHRGADAFALLWRATPSRRWLGRLISLPIVRPMARVLYDWFADRLYAWNRRHGRW